LQSFEYFEDIIKKSQSTSRALVAELMLFVSFDTQLYTLCLFIFDIYSIK